MEKRLTFFAAKTLYISRENILVPKTICIYSPHSFRVCKFTTMGEALINLACQYPALWEKQDAMYKDGNYKEAKWKEIAEVEIFEGHFH